MATTEMNEKVTETVKGSKPAKAIVLDIDGEEYRLEYNRSAIKKMEAKGFEITAIDTKLITSIDLLIEGSFYKNYPKLTSSKLDTLREDILNEYDIDEMLPVFVEMITDALPKSTGKKKNFTVVRA